VITSPLVNAAANLCLKAVDLTLKFSLAPHMNKTAYFDDILAQALNVLQVGVLFKFIKDKADGVVKGEGLGGDQAGVFFVGGALAAICPLLFTAMYECFWKLVVLYRKIMLAQAKIKDGVKAFHNAVDQDSAVDQGAYQMKQKKALIKAFRAGNIIARNNRRQTPEAVAAPNSVAGLDLSEAQMTEYADIMAQLLTTKDGKVVFEAAKKMKAKYLCELNTAEPLLGSDEIDPLTKMMCLLKALQTVKDDHSYKDALEMDGNKDLLFRLLKLPAGLDQLPAGPDRNDVASRLNSGPLIVDIDRFRKVMQMCSDFDPEKVKEYIRKAKLVLFELPWPEQYTLEPLRIYVGVTVQEVVLSVKCSHESETSKYLCGTS
jgi:hypothetical protein